MRRSRQFLYVLFLAACSGRASVEDDGIDAAAGASGTGGRAGSAGASGSSGESGTGSFAGKVGASGSPGPGGRGGTGGDGGFVGGGNCYFGTAPPPSSTVVGSGFDDWNGEPVHGCYLAAQSFPSGCANGVIRDGRFSLTASTCTGVGWRVTIGSGSRQLDCDGYVITPLNCRCGGGVAGGPGVGCDAGSDAGTGVSDASADTAPSDSSSDAALGT
jgi:hypothetical protein